MHKIGPHLLVFFTADHAHKAIPTARDFVALPAAERAAHRHAISHTPARDHAHHQPTHQRGDRVAVQPVPKQQNEPADDDRPMKLNTNRREELMRLRKLSLHQAFCKPARMTSSGAGRSNQCSKEIPPWCSSKVRPSTVLAPACLASASSEVSPPAR